MGRDVNREIQNGAIFMMVWEKGGGQDGWLGKISREEAYILHGNLCVRPDRSLTLVDRAEGESRLVIGSYLKGMPFHAFTIHVDEEIECYDVREMLERVRVEVGISSPPQSTKAVFTVAERHLPKLLIPHVQSKRTMLLKKWTQKDQLLPQGNSRPVTRDDIEAMRGLTRQIGMVSFRADELLGMPHLGIFDGAEPIALAGFHIYSEDYVEIGNIGVAPACQGRGLGVQITSDICRIAAAKSANVYLCVFADNLPARRIYEKLGFQTVERYTFVDFLF